MCPPTIKSLDLSFSRCNSMSGFSTYLHFSASARGLGVCVCAWRAILMPLYLQRVLISVHSFLLTSLFSISRCLWNLFLSPQNFLQGNITLHNENIPFHTPHSGVFTQNNFNNPAGRAYDSITFFEIIISRQFQPKAACETNDPKTWCLSVCEQSPLTRHLSSSANP